MSAVGHGMDAGLHPSSTWNNPEPEVVLVVNVHGRDRRRDARQRRQPARFRRPLGTAAVEGQGQQCLAAVGPFVRLFDGGFTLDTVRRHRGTA